MHIHDKLKQTGKVNIIEVKATDVIIDEPAIIDAIQPNKLNLLLVVFSESWVGEASSTWLEVYTAYKKLAARQGMILFRNYAERDSIIQPISIYDQLIEWESKLSDLHDIYDLDPEYGTPRSYVDPEKMYSVIFSSDTQLNSLDSILEAMPLPNPLSVGVTNSVYGETMEVFATHLYKHRTDVQEAIEQAHFISLAKQWASAHFTSVTTLMTLHSFHLVDPEKDVK